MGSLLAFIATGNVDGVACGASEEDVRDTFGEPSDVSVSREPATLKYEGLEVMLRCGRVETLHVELDQCLPAFLDADGFTKDSTRAEIEERLRERGIHQEPYPPLTFEDDQGAIRSIAAGVVMVFWGDKLFAISATAT